MEKYKINKFNAMLIEECFKLKHNQNIMLKCLEKIIDNNKGETPSELKELDIIAECMLDLIRNEKM